MVERLQAAGMPTLDISGIEAAQARPHFHRLQAAQATTCTQRVLLWCHRLAPLEHGDRFPAQQAT